MKPKKSLGQHFLKSEKTLSQIVGAADIHTDDIVLEIGPGEGVLTEKMLPLADKIIAIEKDKDLIPLLQEKFSDAIASQRLELLEKDVLTFSPNELAKNYKLVANIPYYITGAIFQQFLSAQNQPTQMVVLIQKEVADRIIARDKKESILSLSVKAYGTPKFIAKVPAGAFNPPPKVDSAILSIENISRDFFKDCNEELFFNVLKKTFGGKRKQLQKTLGDFLGSNEKAHNILSMCGLDPKVRPEDLTLSEWKKIIQILV